MNEQTDTQLLSAYAEHRSDPAFAELVRRHLDFVHSAAQRMVCDSHLAEDVTQGVFVALAKNAPQLLDRPVLSGWLHRTAQNIAAQTVRTDVRRRAREQEAATMSQLFSTEPEAGWEQIAPHLDSALGELSELDRDAVLLRYFERKSAPEMAQTLGISDEAAQKRVSRAVERLREFFAKRGVTVGAGGLVVIISAHAVQAAPAGLAITVSTAAALTGTTLTTTAAATATKAIAMTTLQKTLLAALVIAGVATPLVMQHQAQTGLRQENDRLHANELLLRQQVSEFGQLAAENRRLSNLVATASALPPARGNANSELLRLRGEVARLRADLRTNAPHSDTMAAYLKSPAMMEMIHGQQRALYSSAVDKHYTKLFDDLHLTPEQAAALKELLVKRSLGQADKGIAMVSGELDKGDREAGLKKYHDDEQAINEQIHQLLGEQYAAFQDFDATIPSRVKLANFKDEMANSPTPLSPEQETKLAETLFEVQRSLKLSDSYGDQAKIVADPDSYLTGEKWQRLLQETEQGKQEYLTRVKGFLSPEQFDVLERLVTRDLELQLAELQANIKLILAAHKNTSP